MDNTLSRKPEACPSPKEVLEITRNLCHNHNQGGTLPTPFSTIAQTVSTILSPVVEVTSLHNIDLGSVTLFFIGAVKHQGSARNPDSSIPGDANDAALNLLTLVRLRQLGHTATVDSNFYANQCLTTYEYGRSSSFSANCNLALALLELEPEAIDQFASQIEKVLTFLLDLTQTRDFGITDKCNNTFEYSSMLLVEVFVLALKKYSTGYLTMIEQKLFVHRIPMALCRIINQILAIQESNSLWAHSIEVTSYCVLALSHVLRLPWCQSLHECLMNRVKRAQGFLQTQYPELVIAEKDYLLVEKATFQPSLLGMAYCSAALNTTIPSEEWSSLVTSIFTLADSGSRPDKMRKLFLMLPLLDKLLPAMLDLALVEANLHASNLANERNSVLPRSRLPLSQDKYLGYIPIIWLLANHVNDQVLGVTVIDDMLKLSQLTFQIDEFMETTVAALSLSQISVLELWIQYKCRSVSTTNAQDVTRCNEHYSNSHSDEKCSNGLQQGEACAYGSSGQSSMLSVVQVGLHNFVDHILYHRAVVASSSLNQHLLALELSNYLLAHVRQNKDNSELKANGSSSGGTQLPHLSYFTWARSIGADSTSCPFAFRFFMCLISKKQDHFDSAEAQYYSSSVARHLATMCRQYNDCGSVARDADENNLNSIDFAEFKAELRGSESAKLDSDCDNSRIGERGLLSDGLVSATESLLAIAEFERQLMTTSFNALENVVGSPEITNALKVLIDVTDLFGQLYVAKDIASRKQASNGKVQG